MYSHDLQSTSNVLCIAAQWDPVFYRTARNGYKINIVNRIQHWISFEATMGKHVQIGE